MAVYKVIQNVEAEDKLVGPLTFKQFIYAIISGACIFINFKILISANLGIMRWVLLAGFSMPMVLFAVLAAPLGGDQPTELWLLSHLKFMFRPHQRTWSQEGTIQTVTITAPKRETTRLTKDISQGEVQSRLKALATILDSRGWAIQSTPDFETAASQLQSGGGDRLVGVDIASADSPLVDVRPADDTLNTQTNATAQRYGALVKEAEEQKRRSIEARLKSSEEPAVPATPKQEAWGVQNINPLAVVEPDVPSSFDIKPPVTFNQVPVEEKADPDLEMRLKAAESSIHAQKHYDDTSPLAAERKRREERRLLARNGSTKANLATSDNFSVSTIAAIANRGSNEQLIGSMPY